ncbi:hypothetical protein [Ekhidna sp.]|uniref:hypothetical protein n=1 Tax=Ekhidna sp. TaxID=2608089 RepID=UPI003BAC6303
MKSKFFLPSLLLFIFSCSDNEQVNDIVLESPESGIDIDWCFQACDSEVSGCFSSASENRAWRLNDCQSIGTLVWRNVYCTVIIGYEQVPVYSPEGEFIRWDQVPIYGQEVCDQEQVIVRTPAEEQEYNTCVENAQQEFVDAMDACETKYVSCQNKCNKPPKPPREDPPELPSGVN